MGTRGNVVLGAWDGIIGDRIMTAGLRESLTD